MRGSSSSDDVSGLHWHTTTLWWPVECVPTVLEVVHPRRLTALEWAILRVVDAFDTHPPPLSEVAEELGIADTVFLEDTVRNVVRLRALVPRDVTWQDLPDLTFTRSGRRLFRTGRIEGEPAEHGAVFYFDALTDQDLPESKALRDHVDTPFPPGSPAPAPREGVGLDRSRRIVAQFHPALVEGDGQVTRATPRSDRAPSVRWAPVELHLRLTHEGKLVPTGRTLTPDRRDLLSSSEPTDVFSPNLHTATWRTSPTPTSTPCDIADWQARTENTVPVASVIQRSRATLDATKRILYLHAGWWGQPALQKRARELARTGRCVFVLGTDAPSPMATLVGKGLVAELPSTRPIPAALVADGCAGLLIDRVKVHWGDAPVPVELAGMVTADEAGTLQDALREAALAVLPRPNPPCSGPVLSLDTDPDAAATELMMHPDMGASLARLAASGEAQELAGCVAVANALAPGADRVTLLLRLGTVARRFVPALTETATLAPAADAWRALLPQAPRAGQATALLARLAPEDGAAEFVAFMCDRLRGETVRQRAKLLLDLRASVDRRWGAGCCEAIEAYRHARDRLVRDASAPLATRVDVARELLGEDDLRTWAHAELMAIPPPALPEEFRAWRTTTVPLATVVGERMRAVAVDHLDQWLAEGTPSEILALAPQAAGLIEPEMLLTHLLPADPDVADVLDAATQLRSVGVRLEEKLVWQRAHTTLPPPSSIQSTLDVVDTVEELRAVGVRHPRAAETGKRWARQVVEAIPTPREPEGLVWWLGEVKPLLPLTSDPAELVRGPVRRFARPLGVAREQDGEVWRQVKDAWEELGLEPSTLVALVATTSSSRADAPTNRKKRKNKRRRR